MHIAKDNVDVRMEIPGAVIRQRTDFGIVKEVASMSGEYFTLSAGVDTTPLFKDWKATSANALTGLRHTWSAHHHRCDRRAGDGEGE